VLVGGPGTEAGEGGGSIGELVDQIGGDLLGRRPEGADQVGAGHDVELRANADCDGDGEYRDDNNLVCQWWWR
jgi:hypothetical protein